MSFSGLSAILLFSFAIPVVMKYRIFPMEGTPYWMFGMLFLSLIGYAICSVYPDILEKLFPVLKKNIVRIRFFLLILSICLSLGGASFTAIADRHRVAPVWGTHDIILQQEAAMRYLLQKKNPYKETYFGTPMEMFHYEEIGKPNAVNPALYHFVMPPGYLLIPFPFYWTANRLFGYFDGRMVLLVFMAGLLFLISQWFKRKDLAELAIILTALSPAATDYFIEGRSDLFALFWLVASLFFLSRKNFMLSAVIMGVALTTKQTIWFAFPLWLVYVWTLAKKNTYTVLLHGFIACLVGAVITLPFFLWDPHAFFESVIAYLSAGGPTGYPVSGYGLSMILYSMGVIKGLHDYYPFIIWQLLFGVPMIFLTIRFFLKKPVLSRFFIGFALTLFSFWYTSRYFNNSHIAVIAGLFTLGILKKYDEDTTKDSDI